MPFNILRSALRARTSAIHHQLDMATGQFDSVVTYASFVQKTHRFRSALEQSLVSDQDSGWKVDEISPLIALDLVDLGAEMPLPATFTPSPWTKWSRLGAHYVLEGSSIGARLLVHRAEALGLSMQFGARHLSYQAARHDRWRAFLSELEAIPIEMYDQALEAAESTFRFALSVYSEAAYERT